MISLLRYWLVLAVGTCLAAWMVPGIHYNDNWVALALVVLILSLLNAFVKPLLILFTLPFVVLTLGLGLWVINALLLMLVAKVVEDFYVAGFGSALMGAAIISFTHFVAKRLFDGKDKKTHRHRPERNDRVIDV